MLLIVTGVVVVAVLVGVAEPEPTRVRVQMTLVVSWLGCLVLFVAGTGALLMRWHTGRIPRVGWLAAAATAGTIYLASGTLRLYDRTFVSDLGVAAYADVVVALICLVLLQRALTAAPLPRMGPLPLGLGLGVGVLLLHLVLSLVDGDPVLSSVERELVIREVLLACVIVVAIRLSHVGRLRRILRDPLAVVALLVLASRLLGPVGVLGDDVPSMASAVLALLAAAILCVTAVRRLARDRTQSDLVDEHVLAAVTEESRAEQLHELRASLAGVAEAVGLLARDHDELSAEERVRLTRMLDSEVHRLARLVGSADTVHTAPIELDPVLEPLVVSHRLLGRQIRWQPSGCGAVGDADAVAAAVNALLVNAAVHAPGMPVDLDVTEVDGVTRIRVTDTGPGIPAQLRSTIFTRGGRAGTSPGQGLGLYVAHSLAEAQGGTLRLVHSDRGQGAAFDLILPMQHREGHL